MYTTLAAFLRSDRRKTLRFERLSWDTKPRIASAFALIISTWTEIEYDLNILAAEHIMRTDFRVAAAVVEKRNWEARRRLLLGLAEEMLSQDDAELFRHMLGRIAAVADIRHKLVHGIWLRIMGRPERYAVMPATHVTKSVLGFRDDEGRSGRMAVDSPLAKASIVLSPRDIESWANTARMTNAALAFLHRVFDAPEDDGLRALLRPEPPLQQKRRRARTRG